MTDLYFCVGCRQVHNDGDYNEEEGDLIITNWKRFIESVNKLIKKLGLEEKT